MPYLVSPEEIESLDKKPCLTKSILEHPIELLNSPNMYPFYNGWSLNLDTNRKSNAFIRTIFIILLISALLFGKYKSILTYIIMMLVILEILYQINLNPISLLNDNDMNMQQISLPNNVHYGYLDKYNVPYHITPLVSEQEEMCDEPGSCLPLINRDLIWNGQNLVKRTSKMVGPALSSESNVYGNPLLTNYDTAVRSNQSSAFYRTYGDNIMEKAFTRPEYTSLDLRMKSVPDQQLISRPFLLSTTGDFRSA